MTNRQNKSTEPGRGDDRSNARPHVAASARPASSWHGQETRPGQPGSESAEESATRAEGNARLTVAEAARRASTSQTDAPADAPGPIADTPDSEENVEEKREAAAEEHEDNPDHPHRKL